MLLLARGNLFRRYAIVGVHRDGTFTNKRYFISWRSALSDAGFFGDVIPYRVYVWNNLHKQWHQILEVDNS